LSYNNDDKLEEHEIIQKIKSKHDISNLNLTYIKGYVADSPIKDCVRLFTTLNFDVCVDIPKDKIIHVEEISKDKMEFGGTCIWVPKDAELTYTKIERSKIEAQFIEGNIMQDYLGFAKNLDFENTPQAQVMYTMLTPFPTPQRAFISWITITMTASRHCPSQYASCRSQCTSCTA
jgi:hypothetical protein